MFFFFNVSLQCEYLTELLDSLKFFSYICTMPRKKSTTSNSNTTKTSGTASTSRKSTAKSTTSKTTAKKTTTTKKTTTPKTTRKCTPQLERKFVRLSENASKESREKISERVKNGELKWAYYAVDGNTRYHYYLVLK